jgi:uncharacterized protein
MRMADGSIRERFTRAMDALVADIARDRAVLAAILCGSLSHDTVWARSDIDLVLVTVDHRKIKQASVTLDADGHNVHAWLMPRAEFRRLCEGAVAHSFLHSFLAKGRLLYSHDDSLADLLRGLTRRGTRDTRVQLLQAASAVVGPLYKARKWLVTRQDLDYTALWLLYTATSLAKIEVIDAGLLVDREALPQAQKINPDFFAIVYSDLLNTPKAQASVEAALAAAEQYIASRATRLFAPVLDYLREVGDTRSCTDLDDYFKQHFDIDHVVSACEYLADQRLIGKGSAPMRLTIQSTVAVQELAFFHLFEPGDDY